MAGCFEATPCDVPPVTVSMSEVGFVAGEALHT